MRILSEIYLSHAKNLELCSIKVLETIIYPSDEKPAPGGLTQQEMTPGMVLRNADRFIPAQGCKSANAQRLDKEAPDLPKSLWGDGRELLRLLCCMTTISKIELGGSSKWRWLRSI